MARAVYLVALACAVAGLRPAVRSETASVRYDVQYFVGDSYSAALGREFVRGPQDRDRRVDDLRPRVRLILDTERPCANVASCDEVIVTESFEEVGDHARLVLRLEVQRLDGRQHYAEETWACDGLDTDVSHQVDACRSGYLSDLWIMLSDHDDVHPREE